MHGVAHSAERGVDCGLDCGLEMLRCQKLEYSELFGLLA